LDTPDADSAYATVQHFGCKVNDSLYGLNHAAKPEALCFHMHDLFRISAANRSVDCLNFPVTYSANGRRQSKLINEKIASVESMLEHFSPANLFASNSTSNTSPAQSDR
jgi:hypothetical protein